MNSESSYWKKKKPSNVNSYIVGSSCCSNYQRTAIKVIGTQVTQWTTMKGILPFFNRHLRLTNVAVLPRSFHLWFIKIALSQFYVLESNKRTFRSRVNLQIRILAIFELLMHLESTHARTFQHLSTFHLAENPMQHLRFLGLDNIRIFHHLLSQITPQTLQHLPHMSVFRILLLQGTSRMISMICHPQWEGLLC